MRKLILRMLEGLTPPLGCSEGGRRVWGFKMAELWFGYTSLGLHILICKIRSLNLMMILVAVMFHDDDNKFNAEQQFRVSVPHLNQCFPTMPSSSGMPCNPQLSHPPVILFLLWQSLWSSLPEWLGVLIGNYFSSSPVCSGTWICLGKLSLL